LHNAPADGLPAYSVPTWTRRAPGICHSEAIASGRRFGAWTVASVAEVGVAEIHPSDRECAGREQYAVLRSCEAVDHDLIEYVRAKAVRPHECLSTSRDCGRATEMTSPA
jgi:hypothetical protein